MGFMYMGSRQVSVARHVLFDTCTTLLGWFLGDFRFGKKPGLLERFIGSS